jgi:hypothetical protein
MAKVMHGRHLHLTRQPRIRWHRSQLSRNNKRALHEEVGNLRMAVVARRKHFNSYGDSIGFLTLCESVTETLPKFLAHSTS